MNASKWSLWCPNCRQDRDREDFTWNARRRSSYCRECQAAKHREWRATDPGKESQRAAARRARRESPHKVKARQTLYHEIRMGRMVKGDCEFGPDRCAGRVEAHHEDYARPLDVRWLCQHHHRTTEGKAKSCCPPLKPSSADGQSATERHPSPQTSAQKYDTSCDTSSQCPDTARAS